MLILVAFQWSEEKKKPRSAERKRVVTIFEKINAMCNASVSAITVWQKVATRNYYIACSGEGRHPLLKGPVD